MIPPAEIYKLTDELLAKAIAQSDSKPTCSKGCFNCCREPLLTDEATVRYLLDALTPEQYERVTQRTHDWLERFLAGKYEQTAPPKAFEYRRSMLWCPLLAADGTCSVYDRRPVECRIHIARGPVERCANDDLRPTQEFAEIPALMDLIARRTVMSMKEGEGVTFDHMGILLAKLLLGVEVKTKAWIKYARKDSHLEISEYDDKDMAVRDAAQG